MSKGDWKRPRNGGVSKEQYDSNFEAVFGKKEIKIWNPEEDNEQTESVQDQPTCEGGRRGKASSPSPCSTDPDRGSGTESSGQPSDSRD